MAYEIATVKIENPDNRDDYIVIAKAKFDPDRHRLFGSPKTTLVAKVSPAYPDIAVVDEGLSISVARLGPWLAEQSSIELLVRMLDLEKRISAKTLIISRINALKKAP